MLYLIDCWIATSYFGKQNDTKDLSVCGTDRGRKRIERNDNTHSQTREYLGIVRRASIGDPFVAGEKVALTMACFFVGHGDILSFCRRRKG